MTDKEIEFYGVQSPPTGDTGHAVRMLYDAHHSSMRSLIDRVASGKLLDVGYRLSSKGADVEALKLESHFWRMAPHLFRVVAQSMIAASIPSEEDTSVDE